MPTILFIKILEKTNQQEVVRCYFLLMPLWLLLFRKQLTHIDLTLVHRVKSSQKINGFRIRESALTHTTNICTYACTHASTYTYKHTLLLMTVSVFAQTTWQHLVIDMHLMHPRLSLQAVLISSTGLNIMALTLSSHLIKKESYGVIFPCLTVISVRSSKWCHKRCPVEHLNPMQEWAEKKKCGGGGEAGSGETKVAV